jgi:hypothetical protein
MQGGDYTALVLKIILAGVLGISAIGGSMAFFPNWWNNIFGAISGGTLTFPFMFQVLQMHP